MGEKEMKKYKLPEEEKNTTVNEPQMAYGVDMNALKVQGVEALMNIDNPEVLKEAVKAIYKVAKRAWHKDTEGVAEEEETISKEEILAGIREGLMERKEARRTGQRLKRAEELLDEL